MTKIKQNKPTKGEVTRVSTQYTNDFINKVKILQACFAGKNRRALYEALKAKKVISEDYTLEMWDNDFKAWKKNPNNGIFRYLEMAGAILEEAHMSAFEVFGGPHAKDTDEIINGISSRVTGILKPLLDDLKRDKTRKGRAIQKHERIINGKSYENLRTVYDLIRRYFALEPGDLGINVGYIYPFFFLYVMNDIQKGNSLRKPGNPVLVSCIKQLASTIINGFDSDYYCSYFHVESLEMLPPKFVNYEVPQSFDVFFNDYGNLLLIIAYQLNAIIPIYELYRQKRKMLISKKPTKVQTDVPVNIPSEDPPEYTIVDSPKAMYGDFQPRSNAAQKLSEEYYYCALNAELVETMSQSNTENQQKFTKNTLSRIFKNIVECFSKLTQQYRALQTGTVKEKIDPNSNIAIFSQLKKIIYSLQDMAMFLINPVINARNQSPVKINYYIDEKQKNIIQRVTFSAVLQISQGKVVAMEENNLELEKIRGMIEKLSKTSRTSHLSHSDMELEEFVQISIT
jgi:hypothetical protein